MGALELLTALPEWRQAEILEEVRKDLIAEIRVLSFAQKRLWLMEQLQPGSAAYSMPLSLRLSGELEVESLRWSLSEVVRRHEVLRTRFGVLHGEPVQLIEEAKPLVLEVEDLLSGAAEVQALAYRLAKEEAARPFDLERGPLFRARLLHLGEREHVLLVNMHHIVSDGWSMGVLVHEVNVLYGDRLARRSSSLPELTIQYADYASWQREWLQGEVLQKQLDYWRGQLAGIETLDMPTDRPREKSLANRGASVSGWAGRELGDKLRHVTRAENATSFMVLLAVWQMVLSRWSGQQDIAVGTPVANRTRPEIEPLIGFFVNTLVLRTDLSGNPTFREVLDRVREVCLGAYSHQDLPFERLVEELNPERHLDQTPLFQVMFALQNAPLGELALPSLTVRVEGAANETAKFDLLLNVEERGDGLWATLEYRSDLFESETMDRLLGHYSRLLASALERPDVPVSELEMLGVAERRQVLEEWNDTAASYPEDRCLHELIEDQVARTPSSTAVVFEGEQVSYAELNRRSNQLAHHLRDLGVGPEVLVGICLDRSIEMVVAVLAVLKAGGAYVPLDPAYPAERLAFMLQDSAAPILLTHSALAARLPAGTWQTLFIDSLKKPTEVESENPAPLAQPHNAAYVIYTSGSTGKPKGVVNDHSAITNRLIWMQAAYGLTDADRVLQKTSYSFDVSVWELLWPPMVGAAVVLLPPGVQGNMGEIAHTIEHQRVTHVHFVPSVLDLFLQSYEGKNFRNLDRVFCSGEALPLVLAQKSLGQLDVDLHNLYGPTEAAIDVTFHVCVPEESGSTVPIGRPISNTQMYVLDEWMKVVPRGAVGELYIGGAGLARGYLNRPGLTAERFVPDPFLGGGGRLYRTGDLGRWNQGGELEFLGRRDHQVKLRGFRIELEEIESSLRGHHGLAQAVVVVREDVPGDRRLVAYWVPSGASVPEASALREHLQARLPDYMVPSAFVQLEQLPLTPNGKLDRKALPAPERAASGGNYTAPRNHIEEVLVAIWEQALGREGIGVHDNFFDLGGHSLLAVQVVARIRQTIHLRVPLKQFFEMPEIAPLAVAVESGLREHVSDALSALVLIERGGGGLPVSYAQLRLWFMEQLQPGSAAYSIPVSLRLCGDLDAESLRWSLSEVVRRHEVLRTRFGVLHGEPVQLIEEAKPVALEVEDLSSLDEVQAAAHRLAKEAAARPFDLERGPLFRARLLRLGDQEHVLLVNMHHIVSDGWSMGVLVREVSALYKARSGGEPSPLAELPVQYADYASWQRKWLEGEVLQKQLDYWRQQLAGLETLNLPSDYPRPALPSSEGASVEFEIRPEVAEQLRQLSRKQGVTSFMVLLAVWQMVLSRWSGQQDITVGTDVANRMRPEIEPLIGFFVNQLVLRTDLSGNPTFREVLDRVREVCLGAYSHQDLPFERLVEELNPERDLGRSPLFQVKLTLQNAHRARPSLGEIKLEILSSEITGPKLDLQFFFQETGKTFKGTLEYRSDLFESETMDRLLGHYSRLLASALERPDVPVSELEMLGVAERRQVLEEWNDTAASYPEDRCLHELIEDQVARTPSSTAVVFEGEQVSYAELNRRSNQLAHHLRDLGVGPEVLVGICLDRSIEMVVAVLAVLKAGGAYVPLDPAYPAERLAFMLQDSAAPILLTHSALAARLPVIWTQVIELDLAWPEIAEKPEDDLPATSGPQSAAYVIYTSGSTGKPKGVLVQNRSVVHYLCWSRDTYPWNSEGQGALLHSSLAFDLTVTSLFLPLLRGESVVVLGPSDDLSSLSATIGREGPWSLLKLTPAHLGLIGQSTRDPFPGQVSSVIVGGEALSWSDVALWRRADAEARLFNEYGPTEATVGCCVQEAAPAEESGSTVPIGRPISNTQMYVLDEWMKVVPRGAVGELYIGGAGLARGYLNRPGLTAERFVPDPFLGGGGRLYRTGDLGRWNQGGELEFLGRRDHQVKLRGFRIELEEIESSLRGHHGLAQAVVVVREDVPGDRRLVAYWVPSGASVPEASALREHLQARLPDYMVPSAFVQLEQLPLTPNGKLDRKALPAPERAASGGNYTAPRNHIEEVLENQIKRLLQLNRVDINCDLFNLGLQSLTAVQLASKISKAFQIDFGLQEIFRAPTVVGIAETLGVIYADRNLLEKVAALLLKTE